MYLRNGTTMQSYVDVLVTFICPFADWYFYNQYSLHGFLPTGSIVMLSILNGFITIRAYQKTLAPAGQILTDNDRNEVVEKVNFVWMVRSAKLAREIYPDINERYVALAKECKSTQCHKPILIAMGLNILI